MYLQFSRRMYTCMHGMYLYVLAMSCIWYVHIICMPLQARQAQHMNEHWLPTRTSISCSSIDSFMSAPKPIFRSLQKGCCLQHLSVFTEKSPSCTYDGCNEDEWLQSWLVFQLQCTFVRSMVVHTWPGRRRCHDDWSRGTER